LTDLLDRHSVGMTWLAAKTAKATGIFKAVKDLVTTNEILELGLGLMYSKDKNNDDDTSR
jgi:hypothetical protein